MKPEQHREPGRQDAEDSRRAVAVVEEASLGRAPADEEQRRDRHGGDGGHDEESPDDVHGCTSLEVRCGCFGFMSVSCSRA